jgi:hypothetical protein
MFLEIYLACVEANLNLSLSRQKDKGNREGKDKKQLWRWSSECEAEHGSLLSFLQHHHIIFDLTPPSPTSSLSSFPSPFPSAVTISARVSYLVMSAKDFRGVAGAYSDDELLAYFCPLLSPLFSSLLSSTGTSNSTTPSTGTGTGTRGEREGKPRAMIIQRGRSVGGRRKIGRKAEEYWPKNSGGRSKR